MAVSGRRKKSMLACASAKVIAAPGRNAGHLGAHRGGRGGHPGSSAVGRSGDEKGGLGRVLDGAVDPCKSATTAVGFFSMRRPSEIAQLVTSYVEVDDAEGKASIR